VTEGFSGGPVLDEVTGRNASWLEIRLRRRCGDADDPAADRRAPTATRSRDDYR